MLYCHEKLSSSHDDLLVSHNVLKIAHEAMLAKVTSSEPHVDTSTTSSQNAILPCASPCNSSTHNVGTSCEASILKENIELRVQLELLSSNYRKLEESHVKLTSSHDDLLVSHNVLKLAHEAMIAKVTSSEPHVDTSNTSSQNATMC